MNRAAIERLIEDIVWGSNLVTVSTENKEFVSLILKPPTPKDQAIAARAYRLAYAQSVMTNLPTESDLLKDMISIGRWSEEEEDQILGLQKDIHTLKRGLLDFVFNRTKLEKTRALLRRAENVLLEKFVRRSELLQHSAEANAEVARQRTLIRLVTFTEDDESFWPTQESFDNCEDHNLIIQLCEIFFNKLRIPVNKLREIARSQEWRSFWETGKQMNNLFDGPVVGWSMNQRELAYWSCVYDSVYSAYERPSKEIIDDDDLLDSWFIRQGEKLDKKTDASVTKKHVKPGRNEEFIFTDEEGARRVYAMNDMAARSSIQQKQQIVNARGSVKEQHLPDSQNEMREKLMGMRKSHVRDITRRKR